MAKKGCNTHQKERYKSYKTLGKREINKAKKFEKWIKSMIKKVESERGVFVSAKNKIDTNGNKIRVSTKYKHEWTFGPYKKVPNWMTTIIKKYEKHYIK